ncbi:ciliogenesis-associated TTC17-interacting protein isoform X2 [Echinops telfairi]|uniref:Ciliogenesis-associated TTC17-interacting protein isoform X2 n=1 Tax=Echinops telfairi TaxID=9371 RepID=A0AC55DJM3_ECHTE|nr:ciliogenesis-associated TTC17-interacting protein isoform X2 [Echinops telfairi]
MSFKLPSTGLRAKELRPPSTQKESKPLPTANAEAIDFLRSLQPKQLELLLFSETLAMVSDTGEPLGELTVDVQKGQYRDDLSVSAFYLQVHAFSRSSLDNMRCGNSILGHITGEMETLEQHSQEFIKEVKTEVTSFPWNSTAGFLSEAANLVMLRVMAWRQMVPSNARFLALDTEGKLCYATYQALGFQTFQMGRQQAEVFIIEQTVHSEEGIPMSCQYYLLPDGHLAKRVQVGSPGCCIITKMPILREEDEIEPPPVFEKKPLEWEEDMQLLTRFLKRKEELRLSHASYLRHHPEASALISDFLLFLLLRQPADVITFAAEYFGPFSVHSLPTPALRSSHRPSPFRPQPLEGTFSQAFPEED